MAPGFTLKSLSPSRPSVPLSIPSFPHSTNASPLSSPGRSPLASPSASGYFSTHQHPQPLRNGRANGTGVVTREEAFKVVRYLEEVMTAWNEYRMALSNAGRAGRKLAAAMKDLGGCMDKTSVSAQTIKPSAATLEATSELLLKLSKRVDGVYDSANSDASKYFTLLAKESRSHDAYLHAVSKKHDKAEKAYKKASKSLGENGSAHEGLMALKTTLAEDIARANADQDSLLGTKQSGMMLRMASLLGSLSGGLVSFFSEGLRKAGVNHADAEYFRALADIQWQGTLPSDLDGSAELEDKLRDELRLIKTRVALGEMDTVGAQAWDKLSTPAGGGEGGGAGGRAAVPTIPVSAPAPPIEGGHDTGTVRRIEPSNPQSQNAPRTSSQDLVVADRALRVSAQSGHPTVNAKQYTDLSPEASPTDSCSTHTSFKERESQQRPSTANQPTAQRSAETSSSVLTTSSRGSSITLPQSRHSYQASISSRAPIAPLDEQTRQAHPSLCQPAETSHEPSIRPRPAPGPRHVSSSALPSHMGHAPRRSVSQIARDMERQAIHQRQSAFEAHQSHANFVGGCTLCAMDYDRMTQLRQNRRVTMPPAYSQPDETAALQAGDDSRRTSRQYTTSAHDSGDTFDSAMPSTTTTSSDGRTSERAPYRHGLARPRDLGLHAPTPRRALGGSPDFGLGERSF